MEITRKLAHAPKTTAISREIPMLKGPCLACAECDGLCAELIEVMTLPQAVLSRDARPDKDRTE